MPSVPSRSSRRSPWADRDSSSTLWGVSLASTGLDDPRRLLRRDGELAQLRAGLEDAKLGRGRLFLVGGEAGVGKTSLVEAFIASVERTEVRACWGRCWEGGGAPAYWPWMQVLRACVADAPDDETLASQLGAGAADVAQLAPEVCRRLPGLQPSPPSSHADARFRLFDAVASFLVNSAGEAGLIVALDDLHAADDGSLLLLQFVARQLPATHLFVVATYRDPEVRSSPRLQQELSATAKHGTRIELGGLDEAGVATMLDRVAGPGRLRGRAREVHELTGGNPFFVQEAARALALEGQTGVRLALPEEVHSFISQRLQPLNRTLRDLLARDAVLGREFDLLALGALSGAAPDELLDALGEAMRLGVVRDVGLGRWEFSHALLREALYEELRPSERVVLHRQAGDTIEKLHGDEAEAHAAELAHHFFEAARAGDATKAVAYCSLAGQAAMQTVAFEEAELLFGRALEALALSPPVDEGSRYDLLMGLGEARFRAGRFPDARQAYGRALKAARTMGSAELLARAALGFAGIGESAVDHPRVAVLEEALEALPEADSALRAQLLLALANATAWGDQLSGERRRDLARQGLEMARRVGHRGVLLAALWEWHYHAFFLGPDTLEERLAVADELVQLARDAGDDERLVLGRQWRAADLFEAGDIEATKAELDEAMQGAQQLRLPFLLWGATYPRAAVALLEGRLAEAERWARQAVAHGEHSEFAAVELNFLGQMIEVRRQQGRFAEMEELVRRWFDRVGSPPHKDRLRAMAAAAAAVAGRSEEAWKEAAAAAPVVLGGTEEMVLPTVSLAEVSWLLGRADHAASIYQRLLPHAGSHVVDGVAGRSLGSCDRYLAHMATLVGRWEQADAHFDAAQRCHERMGARIWVAHTNVDQARMLLARRGPDDLSRAVELLASARDAYRSMGMSLYEARAADILEAQGLGKEPDGHRAALRREGEYWAVQYGGSLVRVKDSKGMRYLAQLLWHPGQELHALDLVVGDGGDRVGPREGAGMGTGDAGPVLDAQAKAAYKRRLTELQLEVEEARANQDLGRAEKAQVEMDFLLGELSAAVGLGGRDRRAASDAERARQSVTRAIKGAIDRLAVASPELGQHLRTTVHTGVFSSYVPDPRAPVSWRE